LHLLSSRQVIYYATSIASIVLRYLAFLSCLLLSSVCVHAQRSFASVGDAVRYCYGNAFDCQQRHQPDTAMMYLDLLLRIDSNYAPAYNLKGYIYEEHYAKKDSAMVCYKAALKKAPKYAKTYVNIGHLYYLNREYDEAIKYINQALAIDSNYADAYYNLGFIANEQNYRHEALRNMRIAIEKGSSAAVKWMAWYEEQQRLEKEDIERNK